MVQQLMGGTNTMDEHDPKWIDTEKRLMAVIAELDDDYLERVVNAEWGVETTDSHWYDATVQMMYCVVASCGMPVDEFFNDWVVEPHNCYLKREYDKRKKSGAYQKRLPAWDGLNKNFDRAKHNISRKWKHHE
jgi:hypothetical protein|tara:strand:+ start:120 stop:518 length:399 start_codon:yes stop_codon:yes gene_type:complete